MQFKRHIWISERHLAVGDGVYQNTGYYETFTSDLGTLFRSLQKMYGRAVKMGLERDGKPDIQIGWCFQSTVPYDYDPKHVYQRIVWVRVKGMHRRFTR